VSSEDRAGVSLRVAEPREQIDVGRKIARIDPSAMQAMGIAVGDPIEIRGKKVTPVKALPAYPEDRGLDLIRIDAFTRKNCSVSLNENVQVKKAKFDLAIYVKLDPIDANVAVNNNLKSYVKDSLLSYPVIEGDMISIQGRACVIAHRVVNTEPSNIVMINTATEVDIVSRQCPTTHTLPPIELVRENRSYHRFRCLKWVEKLYAADETWFYIPNRNERSKDETTIITMARKIASEEMKTLEIRVELLEKRGSIEPKGFPWAEVGPRDEIHYTYPGEWLNYPRCFTR